MHLLFLNVAKNMLALWNDKCKNLTEFDKEFHLPDDVFEALCKELENCCGTFPSQFGRPFPDLYNHPSDFTAENWMNFVTLTSSVLLHNHLPKKYLRNWNIFVHATKLCMKLEISIGDVRDISLVRGICHWIRKVCSHFGLLHSVPL
jgi:hypothetical protein